MTDDAALERARVEQAFVDGSVEGSPIDRDGRRLLEEGVAVFEPGASDTLPFDPIDAYPHVVLIETNGSEPEVTTTLRGDAPEMIHIDWDEVARGDDKSYVLSILEQIEELEVGDVKAPTHVGMPAVVQQLRDRLAEYDDAG